MEALEDTIMQSGVDKAAAMMKEFDATFRTSEAIEKGNTFSQQSP